MPGVGILKKLGVRPGPPPPPPPLSAGKKGGGPAPAKPQRAPAAAPPAAADPEAKARDVRFADDDEPTTEDSYDFKDIDLASEIFNFKIPPPRPKPPRKHLPPLLAASAAPEADQEDTVDASLPDDDVEEEEEAAADLTVMEVDVPNEERVLDDRIAEAYLTKSDRIGGDGEHRPEEDRPTALEAKLKGEAGQNLAKFLLDHEGRELSMEDVVRLEQLLNETELEEERVAGDGAGELPVERAGEVPDDEAKPQPDRDDDELEDEQHPRRSAVRFGHTEIRDVHGVLLGFDDDDDFLRESSSEGEGIERVLANGRAHHLADVAFFSEEKRTRPLPDDFYEPVGPPDMRHLKPDLSGYRPPEPSANVGDPFAWRRRGKRRYDSYSYEPLSSRARKIPSINKILDGCQEVEDMIVARDLSPPGTLTGTAERRRKRKPPPPVPPPPQAWAPPIPPKMRAPSPLPPIPLDGETSPLDGDKIADRVESHADAESSTLDDFYDLDVLSAVESQILPVDVKPEVIVGSRTVSGTHSSVPSSEHEPIEVDETVTAASNSFRTGDDVDTALHVIEEMVAQQTVDLQEQVDAAERERISRREAYERIRSRPPRPPPPMFGLHSLDRASKIHPSSSPPDAPQRPLRRKRVSSSADTPLTVVGVPQQRIEVNGVAVEEDLPPPVKTPRSSNRPKRSVSFHTAEDIRRRIDIQAQHFLRTPRRKDRATAEHSVSSPSANSALTYGSLRRPRPPMTPLYSHVNKEPARTRDAGNQTGADDEEIGYAEDGEDRESLPPALPPKMSDIFRSGSNLAVDSQDPAEEEQQKPPPTDQIKSATTQEEEESSVPDWFRGLRSPDGQPEVAVAVDGHQLESSPATRPLPAPPAPPRHRGGAASKLHGFPANTPIVICGILPKGAEDAAGGGKGSVISEMRVLRLCVSHLEAASIRVSQIETDSLVARCIEQRLAPTLPASEPPPPPSDDDDKRSGGDGGGAERQSDTDQQPQPEQEDHQHHDDDTKPTDEPPRNEEDDNNNNYQSNEWPSDDSGIRPRDPSPIQQQQLMDASYDTRRSDSRSPPATRDPSIRPHDPAPIHQQQLMEPSYDSRRSDRGSPPFARDHGIRPHDPAQIHHQQQIDANHDTRRSDRRSPLASSDADIRLHEAAPIQQQQQLMDSSYETTRSDRQSPSGSSDSDIRASNSAAVHQLRSDLPADVSPDQHHPPSVNDSDARAPDPTPPSTDSRHADPLLALLDANYEARRSDRRSPPATVTDSTTSDSASYVTCDETLHEDLSNGLDNDDLDDDFDFSIERDYGVALDDDDDDDGMGCPTPTTELEADLTLADDEDNISINPLSLSDSLASYVTADAGGLSSHSLLSSDSLLLSFAQQVAAGSDAATSSDLATVAAPDRFVPLFSGSAVPDAVAEDEDDLDHDHRSGDSPPLLPPNRSFLGDWFDKGSVPGHLADNEASDFGEPRRAGSRTESGSPSPPDDEPETMNVDGEGGTSVTEIKKRLHAINRSRSSVGSAKSEPSSPGGQRRTDSGAEEPSPFQRTRSHRSYKHSRFYHGSSESSSSSSSATVQTRVVVRNGAVRRSGRATPKSLGPEDRPPGQNGHGGPPPLVPPKLRQPAASGVGLVDAAQKQENRVSSSSSMFSDVSSEFEVPSTPSQPAHSSPSSDEDVEVEQEQEGQNGQTVVTDGSRKRDSEAGRRKAFLIATEVMTSERVFVDVLRLLTEDFRKAIDRASQLHNQAVIPQEVFSQILDGLPQLLSLNEDLLKDLEDRISNWDENQRISDILASKAPFLKMYASYIRNFPLLTNALEDARKKFPQFSQAVKEFEMSERCKNLAIQNYMLKPVQRIPQYRLLLQDYMKNISETSADYGDTQVALAIVSEVADHANETIRQTETFNTMLQLQNRISGTYFIVKPGRTFIKEGELSKQCRKDRQARTFLLFNDCLLHCSETAQGLLKIHHNLPLTGMKVHPVLKSEEFKNEFNIISVARSFTLAACSQEERDEWIKVLNATIAEHVARKMTFVQAKVAQPNAPDGSPESLGYKAPVWTPDARVTMCQTCAREFTLTFRRHHCRACGKVVCYICSANRAPLRYLQFQAARVCEDCFDILHREINERASVSSDTYEPDVNAREDSLENDEDEKKASAIPSIKDIRAQFKKINIGNISDYKKNNLSKVLQEVTANDEGSSISGHLHVKVKKQFKKQWFVIKDKVLYTYKASQDVAALNSTPLLGFRVERHSTPQEGIDPQLYFELLHDGYPSMQFYADSQDQALRWVEAMKQSSVL